MTIAMCYLSPEGVVLGADSTSSVALTPGGMHYFNHNQKILQIGRNSTLALCTWGLGGLREKSYRTLVAELADDLEVRPAASVADVAERWATIFFGHYSAALGAERAELQALASRPDYDLANVPPPNGAKSEEEQARQTSLQNDYYVGFCIAGYVLPDRTPVMHQINFSLDVVAVPAVIQLTHTSFWGAPNMILRLITGHDRDVRQAILDSGHWGGTEAELDQVLLSNVLSHPVLTIRDAIDFVHTCILSTIKAIKFSSLAQICGGPIELAVITTDREFRWVRHKSFETAITE